MNSLISGIYDCAVAPSGWNDLFENLRAVLNLRLVGVTTIGAPNHSTSVPPRLRHFHSPWDTQHLEMLARLVPIIPRVEQFYKSDIDVPISQMQLIDEGEFRQSEFYRLWVEPKGLRDTCSVVLIKRPNFLATLNASSGADSDLFSSAQRQLLHLLSPHFRRALLISDLLDVASEAQALYQAALDSLSTGVFLVDEQAQILHANRKADALLRLGGPLADVSGQLWTQSSPHRQALLSAIRRACTLPDAALGTWGSGIALTSQGGDTVALYVLPIGMTERRQLLGPGRAAVFVTDGSGARPPSVEVLAALSGLTTAESRAALGIAEGTAPEDLAANLGISLHTLRKQLSNAYHKTGCPSQAALGAYVNRLRLPLA